jgi:hypothetical protein
VADPGEPFDNAPERASRIHQAGHAAIALALGRRFDFIDARTEHGCAHANGLPTWWMPHTPRRRKSQMHPLVSPAFRDRAEPYVMVALAGLEAERLHGTNETGGAHGRGYDLQEAWGVALTIGEHDHDEANAYLVWLRLRTARLLTRPDVHRIVTMIGDALVEQPVLSHTSCRGLIVGGRHTATGLGPSTGWIAPDVPLR